MNKRKVMYTIIIVVIVLMSCGLLSYTRLENERLEYNRAAEEFEIAYENMFESMRKAWEDPENSLKELIGDFAHFWYKYSEFDACLRDLHRREIYPQTHLNLGVERTVLTDAFYQFRDLYYESVETLYLNKNSKKEGWENQLQGISETFEIVTREIEFWEYYKAL